MKLLEVKTWNMKAGAPGLREMVILLIGDFF